MSERSSQRLVSRPVRCRREHWYLVRAELNGGPDVERAALPIEFFRAGEPLARRCLWLRAIAGQSKAELLGWFETPAQATHMRVGRPTAPVTRMSSHAVSERDPKCHPLANIPRWSAYAPPFQIERIVLPARLAPLVDGERAVIVPDLVLEGLALVACGREPGPGPS